MLLIIHGHQTKLLHFICGCSLFPLLTLPGHFHSKFKGKVANNWVTITISCSTWVFLGGFPFKHSTSLTLLNLWGHGPKEQKLKKKNKNKTQKTKTTKKKTPHGRHAHTHIHTYCTQSSGKIWNEECLLFSGKFYTDIKSQDMRKNIRPVQHTNTHLTFSVELSLVLLDAEEMARCRHVPVGQSASFPAFGTAYKKSLSTRAVRVVSLSNPTTLKWNPPNL